MSPCHLCGAPYDDSFPDWNICRQCLADTVPEGSYIDSLGIVWSPDELEEAGGLDEIRQLSFDADVRNKNYGK